MKEVIAFYTELANYYDDNGMFDEAEEVTQHALKTAQYRSLGANPALESFEQMVLQDASTAADLILKGMKGEIPKDEVKQKLESMIKKQESFKFNNKIKKEDEDKILNKILKRNQQKQNVVPQNNMNPANNK